MSPTLAVMRLPHAEGLPLPAYETSGAAGMDLRAAVAEDAPVTLRPGVDNPVYARVTQEDGNQAWSSPIYFIP